MTACRAASCCRGGALTLMSVGWISMSLGVTATPETVEVRPRGLTTISWVLTAAPVAESVTMQGRYASTAEEVVATCAGTPGAASVRQHASRSQAGTVRSQVPDGVPTSRQEHTNAARNRSRASSALWQPETSQTQMLGGESACDPMAVLQSRHVQISHLCRTALGKGGRYTW